MTRLVIDGDAIKYTAAAICEKREVVVTHKKSGDQKSFKNRTEFFGEWRQKSGGWLGEVNKQRIEEGKRPFDPVDDFVIEDKQTPLGIDFMKSVVDTNIQSICNATGRSRYHGFIGKGASWRVNASTIIEYKGNRKDTVKPLLIDDVEEYLQKRHRMEVVRDIEADDALVVSCMENPSQILVGIDKDFNGVEPIWLFNPDKMQEPLYISGLGKLFVEERGKQKYVRGYGRIFFYFQVLSGDDADNYFANSATDKKWGQIKAYNLLKDCKTDAECWAAIVKGYKDLYPEPFEFTGWRGDTLQLDAKKVLAENCTMAWMLRSRDDKFDLDAVLDEHGLGGE